jgi:phosphate transport system permease protein
MRLETRKVLDRSFTGLGMFSIALVSVALVILLAPIVVRGIGAFVFRGTIEHRRALLEQFGHGDRKAIIAEVKQFVPTRNAVIDRVAAFEEDYLVPRSRRQSLDPEQRQRQEMLALHVEDLKQRLRQLLGPRRSLEQHLKDLLPPDGAAAGLTRDEIERLRQLGPDPHKPLMLREQYGETRWDRAQVALRHVLFREEWVLLDPNSGRLEKVARPRAEDFRGTPLEPLFAEIERDVSTLLQPRWTFYWGFITDKSKDAHFFGGIWAEFLGTLYLTLGAILFAVPMGIISAVYLVEYAPENWAIGVLRSCVSTLAGVPSIVFGLFGLAFFLGAIHIPKSVLAGSLTLAILILPVIIRASEEAIRAVPITYKEAALSMGATKWRTILTVILPAALPGILTGIVISMGRAAGETAPIIFTAAVSKGQPLQLWETASQATPALPWNVYNLCSEHAAADQIRHVQYGMVLTLVTLVLLLNGAAIILRARVSSRLTG